MDEERSPLADAEREYRATLDVQPKCGEARVNLAVVLLMTGRATEARDQLTLAKKGGYKVPAGLCIYFIVSSLWGLTERKMLPKAKLVTAPGSAVPPAEPRETSQKKPVPPTKAGPRSKSRGKDAQSNGTFGKLKEMWAEILKQAKKK